MLQFDLSFFLNWVVQPSPMVFSKSRILHMLLGQSQRIWEVWSVAKRSLIPWAFQIPSMSLGAIFVHFHVGNFQPKSSEFHRVELTSKSPKRRGKFDSEIPVLKGSHDYWNFTGWWFQIFLNFHPYLGKISNLTNIFQMGWNHHLVYSGTVFPHVATVDTSGEVAKGGGTEAWASVHAPLALMVSG